jgi:ATP-dependent DNA ligase
MALVFIASVTLAAGFIEPCHPTSTKRPPSRKRWVHEIKHDGFRVIMRGRSKWRLFQVSCQSGVRTI